MLGFVGGFLSAAFALIVGVAIAQVIRQKEGQ
jgi:hypothetical protein